MMNNEFYDDRDVKIFSGDSDANKTPEDSEYVKLINEKKGSRNIRVDNPLPKHQVALLSDVATLKHCTVFVPAKSFHRLYYSLCTPCVRLIEHQPYCLGFSQKAV